MYNVYILLYAYSLYLIVCIAKIYMISQDFLEILMKSPQFHHSWSMYLEKQTQCRCFSMSPMPTLLETPMGTVVEAED